MDPRVTSSIGDVGIHKGKNKGKHDKHHNKDEDEGIGPIEKLLYFCIFL